MFAISYARAAITEYIEDLEDTYLAEKRLEGIRTGRSKTIPIEEIMSRYDLKAESVAC